MSRLRRGLARLAAPGPSATVTAVAPSSSVIDAALKPTPNTLESVPVRAEDGPHGRVWASETRYHLDDYHGGYRVGDFLDIDLSALETLTRCGGLEGLDAKDFLFIDTETTGLSGGAGTIAFLVGVAWFEPPHFVVRQLFTPAPGREGPALREVAARMAAAPALVSYNGRAFDWPLLRSRFVMNRISVPEVQIHVDLLHAARRIWARRVGNARLVNIESTVLGHDRVDDVPGWMIPEIYFDYLATGTSTQMAGVFTHNVLDLVSLAGIAHRLVQGYGDAPDRCDPMDAMGYAKAAMEVERWPLAQRFATRGTAVSGHHGAPAWRLLAKLARRDQDLDREEAALQGVLRTTVPMGASDAHLGLAKFYEHRRKIPETALAHAHHTVLAEGRAAHERRITRLLRRLSGVGGQRRRHKGPSKSGAAPSQTA